MNLIFLLSVILKGVGAGLEVLLQILITREIGVSGYGSYSAWINGADLLFWICFSGLVKCNTFYLSGRDTTIRTFKRKYVCRYVLPALAVAAVAAVLFTRSAAPCVVLAITALELMVLDRSSTLLARGQAKTSVFGEYVLGRTILAAGVLTLGWLDRLNLYTLLALYVCQYGAILVFFTLTGKKGGRGYTDISGEVSLKKWGAFQRSDLMHAMIEQMPVVLQYFFSGAFEAGVVSIVLLVKKLINFISGPTAKIFLPEFSRLYHAGSYDEIRRSYASIMRIQMLIVGPLAVVLLAFPGVLLNILAPELTDYAWLFMICSVIFLLAATLGPCGGILQMTGNEKMDNRCRGAALALMLVIMLLTRRDPYFVLYGLCAQIAVEAVAKYIYVCRWMQRAPVGLGVYLRWWIVPGAVIGVSYLGGVNDSFWGMAGAAGAVFAFALVRELRTESNGIFNKLKGKRGRDKDE